MPRALVPAGLGELGDTDVVQEKAIPGELSFANEIKQLCDKTGINYNDVISLAQNDERIGVSHWEVPGPDSKLGFGGSCFPKDINSLSKFFKDLNVDCDVIDAAIKTNEKVRPEKDWEQLEGRAVINEE